MSNLDRRYWKNEVSGVLAKVVERYLTGEPLNADEVSTMRAYLRQWIEAPIWGFNPGNDPDDLRSLREGIEGLTSTAQISLWLARALDLGIDPL